MTTYPDTIRQDSLISIILGMHLTQVAPTGCDSLPGRFGGLGDASVGRRAGVHRLLHETEKQLAPTLGFAPVKAKRELIEVVRQMLV